MSASTYQPGNKANPMPDKTHWRMASELVIRQRLLIFTSSTWPAESLNSQYRTQTRCNTQVELGASAHPTPREAVQQAGIVFAMLRDDPASRTVWLDEAIGTLAGMAGDAIAIECSTGAGRRTHQTASSHGELPPRRGVQDSWPTTRHRRVRRNPDGSLANG